MPERVLAEAVALLKMCVEEIHRYGQGEHYDAEDTLRRVEEFLRAYGRRAEPPVQVVIHDETHFWPDGKPPSDAEGTDDA